MLKMKKSYFFITVLSVLIFSCAGASAISEAQQKSIMKNCKRIRETLKGIQRSDTSARTDYLPSIYDEVLGSFMIPLNSRLLKNDQNNELLSINQEDFAKVYSEFKTDFVTYSRSMEKLLSINCEENPNDFYSQLEIVRTDREYINLDTEKMSQIIETQKNYVEQLKENL